MVKPYYEDESVTLYHGDALEVMDALDPLDAHLMTDPPYFNVKADDWDRQWKTGDAFLGWLGDVFESTKRHLSASASAWVFASPDMWARGCPPRHTPPKAAGASPTAPQSTSPPAADTTGRRALRRQSSAGY